MKIKKFMNNTKKSTCKGLRKKNTMTQKQYPHKTKNYHEHDQEN